MSGILRNRPTENGSRAKVPFEYRYKLGKMSMAVEEIPNASLSAQLQSYHAFAFDAVYTFITAINQLLLSGLTERDVRGPLLLRVMRSTVFTGVSGVVSFDSNGDRLAEYDLLNMQGDELAPEAATVAVFSTTTLNFSFKSRAGVMWMNGQFGYQPPESLLACDPGFFKEEMSRQCRACPRGMMCVGGVDARFVPCPRGSFANETGSTECRPCPRGNVARDVGSAECSECLPGYAAPEEGMEACKRCEPGSYMPSAQGIRCLPCGKNQITLYSGAEAESECLCSEGSFMCEGRGCIACPEGLHCPTGLALPQQEGGFWTEPVSTGSLQCAFSVLRCRDNLECPAGALGTCAAGREGRACNGCKEKHFPDNNGTCQPCADADLLPTVALLLLALSLLLLLSYKNMDPSQQSHLESGMTYSP